MLFRSELKAALEARGGGLHVLHGRARDAIPRLARSLGVIAVYANRDYDRKQMRATPRLRKLYATLGSISARAKIK